MAANPIGFEPLGLPAPAALTEARVALHWAVQVVAAAARALIPAMPDDSHTSLEWSTPHRLLVGGLTPGKMRLGLRPSDLTLVVVDASGDPQRELPLAGRTLEAAFAWAAEALGSPALGMPSYEMPDHMVAHGGAFGDTDPSALAELARWYASADVLLRDFVASRSYPTEHASPVRCWPHHFDLATLVSLPGGAPSGARTIGVGLFSRRWQLCRALLLRDAVALSGQPSPAGVARGRGLAPERMGRRGVDGHCDLPRCGRNATRACGDGPGIPGRCLARQRRAARRLTTAAGPNHTGPMGNEKKKVLPAPSLLSTHTRPPCAWTVRLTMASPRPAPVRVCCLVCQNRSKRWGIPPPTRDRCPCRRPKTPPHCPPRGPPARCCPLG